MKLKEMNSRFCFPAVILHLSSHVNHDSRIWNAKTLLHSQAGNIIENKHYALGMKFIASPFLHWLSFFLLLN